MKSCLSRLSTIALLIALVGCGGGSSGPKRYRLSGNVTFDGKPIPAGTIYFEPATGPAGSAQIKNGHYDTSSGAGIVGGTHRVMIEGFDGQPGDLGGMGKRIFKPFRTEEDFSPTNGTKDFNVPAEAAVGLVHAKDPA